MFKEMLKKVREEKGITQEVMDEYKEIDKAEKEQKKLEKQARKQAKKEEKNKENNEC